MNRRQDDEDRLDELLAKAFSAKLDEEVVGRITDAVLEERRRVLARNRRRRLLGAASAAALLLGISLWPTFAPSPGDRIESDPVARKENVHRGDRIEDAVSELLSQLEGLKPARALGLARSRIRKLPPPTDEIYRQLAEAIESRPQALAVLLSMAMSMSISNAAAGGALGRVLEEHAGDGFARLDRSLVEGYFQAMWSMSLGGGGGQRGRALVEKLVGLPKTGPIALAALAQSSEKRAADLFWRESHSDCAILSS